MMSTEVSLPSSQQALTPLQSEFTKKAMVMHLLRTQSPGMTRNQRRLARKSLLPLLTLEIAPPQGESSPEASTSADTASPGE